MSTNTKIIQPGLFYHICNRAVGNELLFQKHSDYKNWLEDMSRIILPVSDLHAFCLMSNHYHLLVKTKESMEVNQFSFAINKLQSIHAKRYNYQYSRKGSLFISPFNRIAIYSDAQLAWAFWYIHRNPLHHGITENWQDYPYSSFKHYQNNQTGFLTTDYMLDFFGGLNYMNHHHSLLAESYSHQFKAFSLE
jgi:REP element-mobilizing transposase RayT